jgi:hypothetical protein
MATGDGLFETTVFRGFDTFFVTLPLHLQPPPDDGGGDGDCHGEDCLDGGGDNFVADTGQPSSGLPPARLVTGPENQPLTQGADKSEPAQAASFELESPMPDRRPAPPSQETGTTGFSAALGTLPERRLTASPALPAGQTSSRGPRSLRERSVDRVFALGQGDISRWLDVLRSKYYTTLARRSAAHDDDLGEPFGDERADEVPGLLELLAGQARRQGKDRSMLAT